MRMPNAQTEDEHPMIASEVSYAEYCITELGESEVVTSKIINMFFDFADSYYVINGDIKVTGEHPFFVKVPKGFYLSTDKVDTAEFWCWEYVRNLKVGHIMYDKDMKEIPIDTIEEIEKEIEIVNIDVDGNNTYFAENVLVHNKGSESRPVANAAHTFTENPGVGGDAI
jgi:intein/homing endonuclease